MVINDTRILPARLRGRKEKTGAEIEVTLLSELKKETCLWDVMVEPARKIRVGNKIEFEDGLLMAEVVDNTTSRGRTMTFDFEGAYEDFFKIIAKIGSPALPSEIGREAKLQDFDRYQTVYADSRGGVTVPSAGLHFTPHLLTRLEIKDVNIVRVTLHMGMGHRRPIDVEDLSKYKMDSEEYHIAPEAA